MVSTAVIVFDGRITECYFWQCCSSVVSDLDSMDGLIFSSDVWAWRSVSFSNPPLLRLNTKSRDRHGPFSLTCHQNQFFLSRISYLEEVFLGCIILTHRSRLVVETAWGRNDYFCLCTSWRTDWSTLAFCLEKGSWTWRYWLWTIIIFIHFSGLHVQLWICIAKSFVKIFGRGVFEPLHWGPLTTWRDETRCMSLGQFYCNLMANLIP